MPAIPVGTQELLEHIRPKLDMGQTWWVEGTYTRRPDYARAIDTLESEGYRVVREPDLTTIHQP